MGYLALYRRYRPSGFDGVIGQEHIVQTLINQIKGDRLGHAYLFTGTRGTGKTSVAKIFAKAINCTNSNDGSPCGKCQSCIALSDPSNIDVIEIDAASNNGVNEIRDIRENVQYPPVSCKYKVYIVDEVHMLSGAAFNALLKTLEEPPKHAIFILATTEVHKIPATILSRCMRFDFRLVSTDLISSLIADIYKKEGKEFEEEAVFAIAKAGEGSVRDALSIADIAISHNNGKLTYKDVMDVLGSSGEEQILNFINCIVEGKSGNALKYIDDLCLMGKSIGVLCKDVNALLRDLIIIKACAEPNKILRLPDIKLNEMKKVCDKTDLSRLVRIMEIFSEIGNSLKFTTSPRILFENATLKASFPQTDYDISSLLSRITEIENKIKNGNFQVVDKNEQSTNADIQITPKLSDLSEVELKAKITNGLREQNSEMLLTIFQKLSVTVNGRIVTISVLNDNDFDYVDRKENKDKIIASLKEFAPFELEVKRSRENIEKQEIDDATDRIKKIFGDDIVVIKD